MRRDFFRTAGLLGVLGACLLQPLFAQDTFELEVYPYATAHRGAWEIEGYANYLSRGTKAFEGAVAPTDNQWRFAAQLTRGLTDHWEISAYVLGARVPGDGFAYAGWRARTRFSAPESWRLPVQLGFAAELETSEPRFSESFRAAEFTPILERHFGNVLLLANPTLERHLTGPEKGEWEFEPRARLAFPVGDVTLGLEYHGGWGEIGDFTTFSRRVHVLFPTADFELAGEVELHLGIGFGTSSAGDRLVFKTRFEMPLGGEK